MRGPKPADDHAYLNGVWRCGAPTESALDFGQ